MIRCKEYKDCITSKMKSLRKERGITQRDLAQAAGVSLSAVRKYEQGAQDVGTASYYTVKRIADALHADAESIVEEGR